MALMSGKVYSNTGAPNNADGIDGDIYMQLDGFKTTYRKESGAWVAIGSSLGAIPEILSGVGIPSNLLGADEQYYRNTENQDIYYKQGGAWSLVGNLTGATFAAALDKAGIGKDLATAPNLINSGSLNAVTTVGEYFYLNNVTDTPSPYGLAKVWRENSTYIYQLVQASGYAGKLYNRYTTDGGATWGPWIEYANVGGNASIDFKVLGGTSNNSAVSYAQLISATDNLFASNYQSYSAGTHSLTLQGGQLVRVILIGGGGGGGGIPSGDYNTVTSTAQDGSATSVYPTGSPGAFLLKANGGLLGQSVSTSNGGNPQLGAHGASVGVETEDIYNSLILEHQEGFVALAHGYPPPLRTQPILKKLSLTSKGRGGAGGGTGWGIAGSGSSGAYVEGYIKNKGSVPLQLTLAIGAGGLGNSANAGVGQNGEDGIVVVFFT